MGQAGRRPTGLNWRHPLAPFVLGAWPLRDGGAQVSDVGPRGRHGSFQTTGGTGNWTTIGRHGPAALFASATSPNGISLGPSNVLLPFTPARGLTICSWVRLDQVDASRRIFTIANASGSRVALHVAPAGSLNHVAVGYRNAGGTLTYLPDVTVRNVGDELFVVGVLNPPDAKIYVNGILEATAADVDATNTWSHDSTIAMIGAVTTTTNILNGAVGTTLLFSRELLLPEVLDLYAHLDELFTFEDEQVSGVYIAPPASPAARGGGKGRSTMFIYTGEGTASRRRVYIDLVDATDGVTTETGEAGGQPQLSVNGNPFANTSGTLVHVGNGSYYVELTAAEVATVGIGQVRYKSAATAEAKATFQVVSFNPYDAASMGLTSVAVMGAAIPEPSVILPANPTPQQLFGWLVAMLRNKVEATDSKLRLFKDDGTQICEFPISDDETTFTRGKAQTPT